MKNPSPLIIALAIVIITVLTILARSFFAFEKEMLEGKPAAMPTSAVSELTSPLARPTPPPTEESNHEPIFEVKNALSDHPEIVFNLDVWSVANSNDVTWLTTAGNEFTIDGDDVPGVASNLAYELNTDCTQVESVTNLMKGAFSRYGYGIYHRGRITGQQNFFVGDNFSYKEIWAQNHDIYFLTYQSNANNVQCGLIKLNHVRLNDNINSLEAWENLNQGIVN